MPRREKFRRPSHATVIACLALFVALGSGAYAAGGFSGKQKKQVKKFAKIYSKRFSRKFAKRGPVGPQGLPGPQGAPGPSNVTAMSFTKDESCSAALPLPTGVTSSRPTAGVCVLTFPNPVSDCTGSATVHYRPTGVELLSDHERSAQIHTKSSEPNLMAIDTYQDGVRVNLPVDVVVFC